MQPIRFIQNKRVYLAYNDFRKNIFSELAPKDADAILYLLPWMLSVNHPSVPGYVSQLKKTIMVHGLAANRGIMSREPSFKQRFGIKSPETVLKPSPHAALIQGIYTIGSAGTISQTGYSDCDTWICIEKDDFDHRSREHLSQKINLIKDWLDANLKMPVYFFICNVEDIREACFGDVDDESCGSAQRNVLKEEFYRTTITISGKIPLWWLCFDPATEVDYSLFAAEYDRGVFEDYDCIDLGPLNAVDSDEYFGAALWQFNKALTHPLKSVIKMLLLEMFMAAPKGAMLCHQFRATILSQGMEPVFYDPSMFTLKSVLEYKKEANPDMFAFIKHCCYLRYEIKFYSKKQTIKEKLAKEVFDDFPLSNEDAYRLNGFAEWPLAEQLEFGDMVFQLLMTIFRELKDQQPDTMAMITRRDMTIIARKIAACLEKKHNKVSVVNKPIGNLNLPRLTFMVEKKSWRVMPAVDMAMPLVTCAEIANCIAYLVWNDIYRDLDVRMAPNTTPMTLQEIHNLAKRIKEIFGVFDITRVDFENFLESEKVTKMLVIISFEGSSHLKDMNDFNVLYCNHWGEMFFHRFNSPEKFQAFIQSGGKKFLRTEMFYYIQRNSLYYEKIIERTKKIVSQVFTSIYAAVQR